MEKFLIKLIWIDIEENVTAVLKGIAFGVGRILRPFRIPL
jgi:hypothetical protein